MPLAELFSIAGALAAPAFFLAFGLAAVGAPLLALVCLAAGQLQTTQYIEAYSRRLLRMALTAALPALLALATVCAVGAAKAPWLVDWARAAPLGPGLMAVAIAAYLALLATQRRTGRPSRRARQGSPLLQTLILSILALGILLLLLALADALLGQARAVLHAPGEPLTVAPLVSPDVSALPPLLWTALAAMVPLSMACASVLSLEYLLLLRDREPFGREALSQMLRIAGRSTLRTCLLSVAFLPVLWTRLPEMPGQPEADVFARGLLGLSGACALLACLCAGMVIRAGRPWSKAGPVHLAAVLLWMGLTALLGVAVLSFYAV